jgi:hypothetical protein
LPLEILFAILLTCLEGFYEGLEHTGRRPGRSIRARWLLSLGGLLVPVIVEGQMPYPHTLN